ncbi:MAG TPA: glycosyltransferase family 1 protein [Bryobacteraceae bacterium]|nr:glycosyltransferase family 1 protein [Bryobacteraceae bacterium]
MRIAVDAHAIGRHLTGNEVYVRSLLREFAAIEPESLFFAYVSEPGAEKLVPRKFQTRRVSPNPYLRLGADLTRRVAADRPDLLHVQYTAPLFNRTPIVSTVHDVSFIENPEYFPATRRSQLRMTVARTVKLAHRIITVSEFSRDAILRAYPVLPEKIRVIPNAASPEFRVVSRGRAARTVRDRFGVEAPFIFSVGDLQPRKNHIGLINAFARLLAANPKLPHHLILAGQKTWFTSRVMAAAHASGVASRIHFTGFVSDSDLIQLYNACDCFVFPSFYEGFGLPILEAMACGCAVACSNTSAMPEVAEGAGLLFDPRNPASISRAIADVLLDADLRKRMETRGLQRATHFNWRKSALATLDVYREVVAETRGEGSSRTSALESPVVAPLRPHGKR